MTFGSTFGRVFSPTFQPKSQAAAAAGGWWLAGGIAAANCIAAYQPKGAASYAASLVNLTGNSSYDINAIAAPSWDATNGWIAAANAQLRNNVVATKGWSLLIRYTDYSGGVLVAGSDKAGHLYQVSYYLTIPRVYYGNGDTGSSLNGLTSGVITIIANPTAGFKVYHETTLKNNNTTAAIGASPTAQSFFSYNVGAFKGTGKIQAAAYYYGDITSYLSSLVPAINAL